MTTAGPIREKNKEFKAEWDLDQPNHDNGAGDGTDWADPGRCEAG
jgi:hypothetical protein